MEVQGTHVSAERQTFSAAEFHQWLDQEGTPALISRDHGQYYAYCYEFGVAGMGPSEAEAIKDAERLLVRHLVVSYLQGCSYQAARKRPPARVRLKASYLELRRRFLRGIRPPLSRVGRLISVPTESPSHDLPLVH
jgi:hypothetical protein